MADYGPCIDISLYWLLILFQSPSGYDSWQRKEFSHIANLLKKFWQSAFPPLGNNYKQNQRGILEDYTTLLHKLLRLIIHTYSNIHLLTLLQFVFLKKEVLDFFLGFQLKALTSLNGLNCICMTGMSLHTEWRESYLPLACPVYCHQHLSAYWRNLDSDMAL